MLKNVLILGLFTFPICIRAQYLFETLSTQDGLSSKAVTCLLRDTDGFLWLGTQSGLNRFDGSSVKVFNWAARNYPQDQSEIIRAMVQPAPGILLIGTRSGLLRFSIYTREFVPVPNALSFAAKGNVLMDVYDMVSDTFGNVWIASAQGLGIYTGDSVYSASILFPSLQQLPRQAGLTKEIAQDSLGQGLWLSTDYGFCFIDFASKKFTLYGDAQQPLIASDGLYAFTCNQHTGDIWWSEPGRSLVQYAVKTGETRVYDEWKDDIGKAAVRTMHFDRYGRLWYSTWNGKLFMIDLSGSGAVSLQNGVAPFVLHSGFVNEILDDKNGDIWFATMGGASWISGSNALRHVIAMPGRQTVNAILPFSKTQLIIASGAGLTLYDEITREQRPLSILPDGRAGKALSLLETDSTWWCGTGAGMFILDMEKNSCRIPDLSPFNRDIAGQSVIAMIEDKTGAIWFTTWSGYVYRYNKGGGCIRFDGSEATHGDIGNANCLALTEDSRGRIWVGYGEKGMRLFTDDATGFVKFTHHPDLENCVGSGFAEDDQHRMWVSTWGDGVFLLDSEGNVLAHLTSQDGLTSNYTASLTLDDEGRVWFGTPEALHYLQPGTLAVNKFNFDPESSLGEDWMSMYMGERYGYVSMKHNLLVIDREMLAQQQKAQLPLISSVFIFENEQPFRPDATTLNLTHDQNFFRIEFASPEHRQFLSLQYAYILDGFNKDWVQCERRLSAGFTNVPPGEYTFRVKASDQNGKFNEESRQLRIVIAPPFWRTPWFYAVCLAAAVLAAAYCVYVLRRRRERRKAEQIIDYFANSVYSENSVNEICWDIARNCISQLGFDDCVVYLLDPVRNVLVQKAAFGPKNPQGNEISNPLEIVPGSGIVGTVALEGKALLIPDTSADPRYITDEVVRLSELAVPIMHNQKVIGVIDSEHPDKGYFTREHLRTLSTIASISAIKIADAQSEMEAKENAIKLMEISKLFAESQLEALRARMNPHFIFNCLNGIQECIVTQKYKEASTYLNKFAKLLRLVLNNSGTLLISIDEEVEILSVYLELECMRFERGFTYEISIDPTLESEDILIPSMFLQPFVENALWHGLMHRPDNRRLQIRFEKVSDDVFACCIDDNGIGRKASATQNRRNLFLRKHESRGMKMNNERLEILRREGYHATMKIIDKEDTDGSPLGTTVIAEFSNALNTSVTL